MSPVTRGFHDRRDSPADAGRVPPGQYLTADFPVLSAGPTPHTALADWSFSIRWAGADEPGFWERYGYHNYGDPWREQRYGGD